MGEKPYHHEPSAVASDRVGEPEQWQPDSWVPVSALLPPFALFGETVLSIYFLVVRREQMGEGRGLKGHVLDK